MIYYGIDIGGTKIELSAFNSELEPLYVQRIATPKQDYQQFLDGLAKLVDDADQALGHKAPIGIGIPGFINPKTTRSQLANIPIASNQNLAEDLRHLFGREIKIENDANCFALSESLAPENRDHGCFIGLIIGTGFGGGFIFNHRIHAGSKAMAGEVGHTPLNVQALNAFGCDLPIYRCGCGKMACLDNYLSGRGFEKLYADINGTKLSAQHIIEQFRHADSQTIDFVSSYAELFAGCIAPLITLLDPDAIVFGGGLSNFDELYPEISLALPRYLIKGAVVPSLSKARFGDSGGTRGAAALWLM